MCRKESLDEEDKEEEDLGTDQSMMIEKCSKMRDPGEKFSE